MHLTKKTYVKNWNHTPDEQKFSISVKQNGKDHPYIKKDRISYIEENIGYWRKANHIHKWFVDNVQDGVDQCQITYVDHSQLKDLLDLCKEVKSNHTLAQELLPCSSGFFFGCEDYDDYYFNDIDNTIAIIEEELATVDEDGCYSGSVYYHSSW